MEDLKNYGKGALKERKNIWRPTLKSHLKKFGTPILPTFFDLYETVYSKMPVENQGSSEACSGFAGAQYAQAKTFQRDGVLVTLSKKDIYQGIFVKGGGAYGNDLMNWLENEGVCLDQEIPTYMQPNNIPPTEQYMETEIPRTPMAISDAMAHRFSNAVTFNGHDINEVKQAIISGYGAICAVWGNNACWLNQKGVVGVPSVPPGDPSLWGHFLILTGYSDITKQVRAKSSWGNGVGDLGYFYLPYSYFTKGYSMSEYTLVEVPKGSAPASPSPVELMSRFFWALGRSLGFNI